MKLAVTVKLQPTPEQHAALLTTLERANAASTTLPDLTWECRTFRHHDSHKLAYGQIRTDFSWAVAARKTIPVQRGAWCVAVIQTLLVCMCGGALLLAACLAGLDPGRPGVLGDLVGERRVLERG